MPPSGDGADIGGVPAADLLWSDCVKWLSYCRVLPSTVVVDDLRDFALILRDGVVLCRLANLLEPGCITEAAGGSTLPASQFISNRYISLFIDACVNCFDINRANVFTTDDLYKMENFGKVLRTLSLLSQTDHALSICPEPFPRSSESPSSSRTSSVADYYNNEAIYQCLQKVAEDDDDRDEKENIYDMGVAMENEEQKKHGDIYDTIVVSQRPKRIADRWDAFHPTSKREHCIKELLDTETNYVDNALGMIINNYYAPIKHHLSEVQREVIFMNIADIAVIHNSFRNDLKQAVFAAVKLEDKPNVKDIGAVFLDYKERFVAYGSYCAAMNNSRAMIDDLMRTSSVFKQLVDECARGCGTQFRLQDLMCVPMQRILKYHMLLNLLKESTPMESLDRKSLLDAHDAMQDINMYINEVKRDYEGQQIVAEIQKSIPDLEMPAKMVLSDYGRLIKDGEIKMSFYKDGGKLKSRYIFIFDKVMLVCKLQRNNQYSYKSAHILKDFEVADSENENNNRLNTLTRKFGTTGNYPFYLNHNSSNNSSRNSENGASSSQQQIQFSCKTINQRMAWVEAFQVAKEHVMPEEARENHHKVSYKTFPPATICTICHKLLRGLYYQGYHCEVCGGTFHRECLAFSCPGGRSHSTPGLQHRPSDLEARIRSMNLGSEYVGETVVAKEAINSMDPSVLSFEKHDRIEVVRLLDGGTFLGRLVATPGKSGIVRADCVRRIRNSTHSMSMVSLHNNSPSIQRHESTVLPRPIHSANRMSSSSFTSIHSPQREYYVNMNVNNQPWYFGPLTREIATTKLYGKPNGTFIVRFSEREDRYAISISYLNEVKHTKVEFQEAKYYLDESKQFDSLVELVNYYRDNNLSESFEKIDTVLTAPLIQSSVYRVVHDYTPTEPTKFLTLRHGELVTVLDTSGEERGWWKGQIDNRIGFFPYAYVAAYFEDDDSATENGFV